MAVIWAVKNPPAEYVCVTTEPAPVRCAGAAPASPKFQVKTMWLPLALAVKVVTSPKRVGLVLVATRLVIGVSITLSAALAVAVLIPLVAVTRAV